MDMTYSEAIDYLEKVLDWEAFCAEHTKMKNAIETVVLHNKKMKTKKEVLSDDERSVLEKTATLSSTPQTIWFSIIQEDGNDRVCDLQFQRRFSLKVGVDRLFREADHCLKKEDFDNTELLTIMELAERLNLELPTFV